jgi:hypothetical protein
MRPVLLSALLLVVAATATTAAHAHKPSDSYLRLSVAGDTLTGRWDIALRDLHELLDLDTDGDGAITWAELRASRHAVIDTATGALRIDGDGRACALDFGPLRVVDHSDGPYAVLALQAQCAAAPLERLHIDYQLLFELDASHRGLLNLQFGGTHSAIFASNARSREFDRTLTSGWVLFWNYLHEGAWHIWVGFDHLLFLLCLLLPAVLQRSPEGWVAAPNGRAAFLGVLSVVTAFTVAHAMSLSAAALDWLRLPTRWVEAAVAATIIFAALNNLLPMVRRRLWLVAFGFGLVHGAGYAGVLAGLGLSTASLALALLGFNLGVEGGQILIAAAFMPLAWWARHAGWYRHGVVVPGSVAAILLGGGWLLQRLFHIRLEGLW